MLHQHRGCIVNVSSMWGQTGGSCEVHYSAAKGAIQSMTKALAKEVGPSGIRVNCVAPGVIQTEMNRQLDEETLDALREETPLGLLGTAEDVANLIYFLATSELFEQGGWFCSLDTVCGITQQFEGKRLQSP